MLENAGRHHEHGCGCGGEAISYRRAEPGPISVFTQPVDAFIFEALDRIDAADLPDFRLTATLGELRHRLTTELAGCGFEPAWLSDWLVGNIHFQARLFTELTHAGRLAVRLETIVEDSCPRFHVDNVRYRLLCTFRGPGTEWLDPKASVQGIGGDAVPPAAIRRLERGAIALLRGSAGSSAGRPGLFHRSPPIEGTGLARLLLVIDDTSA